MLLLLAKHRMCNYSNVSFYNLALPGIAAATMFMPETENELSESQLKVAFDGDAVLFSDESEVIVKQHGLDTFFEHEKEFENKPLAQVKQAEACTFTFYTIIIGCLLKSRCAVKECTNIAKEDTKAICLEEDCRGLVRWRLWSLSCLSSRCIPSTSGCLHIFMEKCFSL